uniref:BRO1 domain-containing protein n=1 Tax=Rhizophora mucronata TaxID=61149 RepID=A0A2P2NHD3_RHIMU
MAGQSSAAAGANLMLAIYEKKTTDLDLFRPLCNYISAVYSERGGQNLEDDLRTVNQYRSNLEHQSQPSHSTARRDLLQNYFKALCLVETRFPISPDKDHVNAVIFVWYDAFKPKQKAS